MAIGRTPLTVEEYQQLWDRFSIAALSIEPAALIPETPELIASWELPEREPKLRLEARGGVSREFAGGDSLSTTGDRVDSAF